MVQRCLLTVVVVWSACVSLAAAVHSQSLEESSVSPELATARNLASTWGIGEKFSFLSVESAHPAVDVERCPVLRISHAIMPTPLVSLASVEVERGVFVHIPSKCSLYASRRTQKSGLHDYLQMLSAAVRKSSRQLARAA